MVVLSRRDQLSKARVRPHARDPGSGRGTCALSEAGGSDPTGRSGRHEMSDFDQWVAPDLPYIDWWPVALDPNVVAKTVSHLAPPKGAY